MRAQTRAHEKVVILLVTIGYHGPKVQRSKQNTVGGNT